MMAVVLVLFVYEWTYLAPMLIRQIWDCCFETSPLTVEHFHQATMFWLMGAAVLGVGARRGLVNVAEKKDPAVPLRLETVVGQLQETPYQCPRWLDALLGAAFLTLVSLGFHSIEQSGPIFVGLAAVLLARLYLLPRSKLWTNWTQRISPHATLLRLAAATIATYVICRLILLLPGQAANNYNTGDFKAELAALFIGFALTMVLLPNGVLTAEEDIENTSASPARAAIPSGVAQVGLIVAIVLLATKKAFGDACLDPPCCFGANNGLAGSSTAAGVPSGVATAPGETQEGRLTFKRPPRRSLGPVNVPTGQTPGRPGSPSEGGRGTPGGPPTSRAGEAGGSGTDATPNEHSAGNPEAWNVWNAVIRASLKG